MMAAVNEHDRNHGIDFGAHISSIDPISSSALDASLFPVLPNVYLGGTTAKVKESTTVVQPIVCAVRVRAGETSDG